MYLPKSIPKAKVLVTVKTYPQPSSKYGELVCTAGLLDGNRWVRIYPIPFRYLNDDSRYPKYSWIELDLVKRTRDFRPESYSPKKGIDEEIVVGEKIGTKDNWAARKRYVLQEVFTSMRELIDLAKSDQKKSLATLKPKEIVDFVYRRCRGSTQRTQNGTDRGAAPSYRPCTPTLGRWQSAPRGWSPGYTRRWIWAAQPPPSAPAVRYRLPRRSYWWPEPHRKGPGVRPSSQIFYPPGAGLSEFCRR